MLDSLSPPLVLRRKTTSEILPAVVARRFVIVCALLRIAASASGFNVLAQEIVEAFRRQVVPAAGLLVALIGDPRGRALGCRDRAYAARRRIRCLWLRHQTSIATPPSCAAILFWPRLRAPTRPSRPSEWRHTDRSERSNRLECPRPQAKLRRCARETCCTRRVWLLRA